KLGQVGADLPPASGSDDVRKLVGDELLRREAEKQARDSAADDEGYKVGTNLGMTVRWNPLNGLTFETPNKDFTSHLGFWFQLDTVAFTQSPGLRSPNQIGDLQDGTFFRR